VLLERELERFENLLEDLLEISRFDAGVINLEPVEVDVSRLLDEVVDALDPIAHGRKVDVGLEVDRSQGQPLVAADPRRLDRVFSNLVKNAIEHTVEGGVRIWVGRRGPRRGGHRRRRGRGHPGRGPAPHLRALLPADVHRARTLGGTGLGLAIALENVNLHRGSIDVQSEVGRGSTFTVTLPASTPSRSRWATGGRDAAEPAPVRRSPSVANRPGRLLRPVVVLAVLGGLAACTAGVPQTDEVVSVSSVTSAPQSVDPRPSGTSAARSPGRRDRRGRRVHERHEHRRRRQDPAVGDARADRRSSAGRRDGHCAGVQRLRAGRRSTSAGTTG
jgi:hypothetical protein